MNYFHPSFWLLGLLAAVAVPTVQQHCVGQATAQLTAAPRPIQQVQITHVSNQATGITITGVN